MNSNPTIIVLAAGLGSRYGSLKQFDRFDENGETLFGYTVYDAIKVGFKKIIFVIRRDIELEFKEILKQSAYDGVQIEYVFQELDDLPAGRRIPKGRKKPWGTGHAVLTAAPKIQGPFAIVNADDFYGRASLKIVYDYLVESDDSKLDACLIGFILENTLSDHGGVSRGVCELNDENELSGITERTHVTKNQESGAYYLENGMHHELTGKEIVSMNLMGFTSPVIELMTDMFIEFLDHDDTDLKSEFFIPLVLDRVRHEGLPVPVITSNEQWFGVTYPADKPVVKQRLMDLVKSGMYPTNL